MLEKISGNSDATEISTILGYNDAQAFQGNGSDDYGPVVRLYAVPKVWSPGELASGKVVAVLEVAPSMAMPKVYRDLKLKSSTKTEYYCVSVQQTGAAWKGSVDQLAPQDTDCPVPGWNLNADLQEVADFTHEDSLPSFAARFTDDQAGNPSITTRCLTGWCEIGRAAGHEPPMSPGKPVKEDKVKPWSDEQRLARPDAATGLKRAARASLVPAAGLGKKKEADFKSGGTKWDDITGIKVATIMLAGSRPGGNKYKNWGLMSGTLGSPASTDVWMRLVDGDYQAQFVGSGAVADPTGKWFYVFRTAHQIAVPGTARWIWDPADEGVWIACDQGCCEISQDPFVAPTKLDTLGGRGRGRGGL